MKQHNDELQHHGVLGMKWGVRRYQNKDGSLTPAGRKRADKLQKKYSELTGRKLVKNHRDDLHKKKNVNNMSDEELAKRASRLELENRYVSAINNYNNLNPKQVSRGKLIANKVLNDVVVPAATKVGKNAVEKMLSDMLDAKTSKKKK